MEKPLKPGTVLDVFFELPGYPKPVQCQAEVVWCESYTVVGKEETGHRAIEAGVRFLSMAPHDRETVMKHVILGFVDPKPLDS